MYWCSDCQCIVDDDEVATWREDRGEFWGQPAYEEVSGCPYCYGGLEEYCGQDQMPEDDDEYYDVIASIKEETKDEPTKIIGSARLLWYKTEWAYDHGFDEGYEDVKFVYDKKLQKVISAINSWDEDKLEYCPFVADAIKNALISKGETHPN